jgi:hypothetical protein
MAMPLMIQIIRPTYPVQPVGSHSGFNLRSDDTDKIGEDCLEHLQAGQHPFRIEINQVAIIVI